MATTDTPASPLDRVARDLSRTLWHGSRPTDNNGNVTASTIATAQQIRVDVPAGSDLNFAFSAGVSTLQVVTPNAQASATDGFMNDALGASAKTYLSLDADPDIPTWVFQQRQFSTIKPPPADDLGFAPPLTVIKLPSAALQEAQLAGGNSYVSLLTMNPATLIPQASWQPAIVVRFPLRPTSAVLADGTKVYELMGTPEGDRWFLDQLGLLPLGQTFPEHPAIESISLALEKTDASNKPLPPSPLTSWSIARTNLTREARANAPMDLAVRATAPAPVFPYIVLSGEPGQNEDAVSLLEMASITNSGGYFLSAATDWTDAKTLLLTVVLQPKTDSDITHQESGWLPLAANAVALAATTPAPDVVRFNGLLQIEVAPYTPPGTVSFGWTRTVLQNPTSLEDQFGYGTLSIVDYSATDGTGTAVPLGSTIPVISPLNSLPGDQIKAPAPPTPAGAEDAPPARTAAIRVGSAQTTPSIPTDAADIDPTATELHYYRASIYCYDKQTESPWKRLSDSNARSITLKPGIRDVFGNRFDPFKAPAFTCRMFYTDAIVRPSEWPGVRFAIYPLVSGGSPCLSLEMSYSAADANANRKQRLTDICYQLQGVDNDVQISFTASPLVTTAAILDNNTIITQLKAWANGDTNNLILTLKTVVCTSAITVPTQLDPEVTVTRTKAEYLPLPADLPDDKDLANLINSQVTSASSPAAMQSDATPPSAPDGSSQPDTFLAVATQFQAVLSGPLQMYVGFLRDQANIHELWLIPNSAFPVVSADPAVSSKWAFATPCPLSSVLGNDSFPVPDFTTSSTAPGSWQNFPLKDQAIVDQDFDQLGRVALSLIEAPTADLNSLMLRGNAATMRSLLQTRETIANQLAIYQNDGFLVSLFADAAPGDIDGAAVSRTAKDAFLTNINAFYRVSTILQLPLVKAGSTTIQTFEGTVAPAWVGTAPTPPPTFSDVLLGGGDQKVTLLYDLPPGVTAADGIPAIATLNVSISNVQMPLKGAPPGASPFNEGPWIQLVKQYPLSWHGYPEYIPVADRIFPTKPVIQSTTALKAWTDPATQTFTPPAKIDVAVAPLLTQWGWRFSFGLINASPTDKVHIAINYLLPALSSPVPLDLDLDPGWSPVSLLHSLVVLKLLSDNWGNPAVIAARLTVLAQLASFFAGYVAQGPPANALARGPLSAGNTVSDLFTLGLRAAKVTAVATPVMTKPPVVQWTPTTNGVDLATLTAPADAVGNTACLTGVNPVRSFKISLTLLRNETLGKASPRPGNKLLIYQCAPVESPLDCRPLNQWTPVVGTDALQFDMTAQPSMQGAFQAFLDGILHTSDLSNLGLEVGLSLAWAKGNMTGDTRFSILPSNLPPEGSIGTPAKPAPAGAVVAAFLYKRCQELLAKDLSSSLVQPPEVDSASIRLRVKLTAADPDTPSGRRTLMEVTAIDFSLASSS